MDVVQIAAECAEGVQIAEAGANRSDLQWLVPVRIENDHSHDQGAVFLLLTFDCDGVPHLLMIGTALISPNMCFLL